MALGISLLAMGGPSPREIGTALAGAGALCAAILVLANPLFNDLYEKLLFKTEYQPHQSFSHLVENRSGVIAVSQQGEVFGGGIYDGWYNVDPVHDVNGLFRIYALSSFHPLPRKVLMIGLSSGSWAQIVANDSEVQSMDIIEINPGYLPLIPQYPQVRSLLDNPKVHVVIDDRLAMAAGKSRYQVRRHHNEHLFQLARTHYQLAVS